jgi:uncharacterized membrane protein HdeD (DUF308 family)
MNALPNQQSDLSSRGRGIAICGWLIILLSAGSALLPLVERQGGARIIGLLLIAAGALEAFAGTLRHEARKLAILAGLVTVAAGLAFLFGPATEEFLPHLTIVMGWLFVRTAILLASSRYERGGVRRWTVISAATDGVLGLLLLVGLQIATFVVALFGATAPMVASFAWVLALSFITDGLLQLEIASCARQAEDV